jgi:hypothetical protein
MSPRIDSKNEFLAGRYDNTIPTQFLAPKDCFKIPAQLADSGTGGGGECVDVPSAGIFKQSMWAMNRVGIRLS